MIVLRREEDDRGARTWAKRRFLWSPILKLLDLSLHSGVKYTSRLRKHAANRCLYSTSNCKSHGHFWWRKYKPL